MHPAFSVLPVMPVPSDSSAFEELVLRHQAQVLGATLSVVGDRARAEELAQEALFLAWRKLEDAEHVDNRAAWLCTIARNLARNARRRGSREVAGETDAAADTPSPLDDLVEREDAASVQRALAALPEKYREPLVLFYVGGESVRAVAEALALEEGTVRKRLERGRDRVREQLSSVEKGLRAQRPGPAFTALVLAAWSVRPSSATAATASTVGVGVKLVVLGAAGVVLVARPHGKVASAPLASLSTPARASVSRGASSSARTTSAVAGTVPSSTRAGPSVDPTLPAGLNTEFDLDFHHFTADAAFNVIGAVCDVPIVVAPGEDFSAEMNVKANNRSGADVLDELLAQAGAERRNADILRIGEGLGRVELPSSAPMDLEADGVPLPQVIAQIATHLGEPIFAPLAMAETLVHVKLHAVTPAQALVAVLGPIGFGYERKAGLVISLEDQP